MDAHSLGQFLVSLVILVVAAHFFGHWFERLKLPRVIGEISAGIFLGPSVIGGLSWGAYDLFLFDEFVGHKVLLNAFYWLGLCMLMFTSGFHIQLRLPADERRDIGLLVIATSTVPFALGWWAVSFLPVDQYTMYSANLVAFKIVFAVSVTVTSIPVISKIFMDLGLMPTKFAKVVVATATFHDIVLWTAIAVATTVQASGDVRPGELVRAVLVCLVFIAFFVLLGPRFIEFINRIAPRFSHLYPVGYLLIVCLAMAALASYIDVGAVFGALIAGMLFGSQTRREFQEARETVRTFSMSFFGIFQRGGHPDGVARHADRRPLRDDRLEFQRGDDDARRPRHCASEPRLQHRHHQPALLCHADPHCSGDEPRLRRLVSLRDRPAARALRGRARSHRPGRGLARRTPRPASERPGSPIDVHASCAARPEQIGRVPQPAMWSANEK
jgi:Kef-type K+ transport system membrane component KefB